MNYQHIVLGILIFSFIINSFFMINDNLFSNNIIELSFNNLNNLNNISYIEVYNKKIAYIYTKDYFNKINSTEIIPEYLYNIGNNEIFNSYIMKSSIDIYYKNHTNYLKSFFGSLPNFILIILIIRILIIQSNQISNNSNKKMDLIKDIKVKFNDIAGLKEVKQEVNEFVDILGGLDKYTKIGCKVPRGALFYGSPGTGKTLIAKAIAGECDASFIHVSGSGFNEVYVGLGQSRVRNLFEKARENSPCIIFIDEIDTLGAKRSYRSSHSEHENTLNALLAEMDGIEENLNIMVFGATNRPESLDPALLRAGRFDRKIQFNLPTREERNEIFKLYLKKYITEDSLLQSVSDISDKAMGLSGAEISNLCNEAGIITVRNKRDKVTLRDLDEAFNYIAVGLKRSSNKLNENDKRCVSFHETGHAFMSYIQKNTESPIKVSIIPTTKGALGYSMSLDNEENLKNSRQLYQQMAVLLGGRCSEKLFMEYVTTGASNDLMKLRDLCKRYISEYGFIDEFNNNYLNIDMEDISENTKYDIDKKVQDLINEVTDYTLNTLKKYEKKVIKMANILYKKEELNKLEISNILGRKIESTLK